MNILFGVLGNLIILGLILLGLFVGKKNGWKVELTKLILTVGAGIGFYFLAPVLTEALVPLIGIDILAVPYSIAVLNNLILFLLVIIFYAILCSIIRCIVDKHVIKKYQIVRLKIKGKKNRNINRLNKKQFKLRIKEAKKQSTSSKVIGSILGIVLALALSLVIFMLFKYVLLMLSDVNANLYYIFQYTIFGQLDKIIKL